MGAPGDRADDPSSLMRVRIASIKRIVGGVALLTVSASLAWWALFIEQHQPTSALPGPHDDKPEQRTHKPSVAPSGSIERPQAKDSPAQVAGEDHLNTQEPHAQELAAFEDVVDDLLTEQPNIALLTIEWSTNGPIAIFQYQGDDVHEVYESAGERGQFMTLDDSDSDHDDLDAATPPFVALIDIPSGDPLPKESMKDFILIVAGLNPEVRGVSDIQQVRSWERAN